MNGNGLFQSLPTFSLWPNFLKSGLFGISFTSMGALFLVLMSITADGICERIEPKLVNCTIHRSIYQIIPIKSENMTGVQTAWVDEECDSDGCTYRVVLTTSSGDIPVTIMYSSGYNAKQQVVDQINEYLTSPDMDIFTFTVSALEGVKFLIFLPILFIIIGVGAGLLSLFQFLRRGVL